MRLSLLGCLLPLSLSLPTGAVEGYPSDALTKPLLPSPGGLARYKALVRPAEEISRGAIEPPEADGADVAQHQALIRLPGRSKRYLQSFGAGPCVILTLHHRQSKTAALAHLDAKTDVEGSIRAMFDAMRVPPNEVDARLIGGYVLISDDVFIEAIETLDRLKAMVREVAVKKDMKTLRYTEMVDGTPRRYVSYGDAIALDSETGTVYDMTRPTLPEHRSQRLPSADDITPVRIDFAR